MVVFNCNACGEALKKNQVEKHTSRCRNCEALSCVDCGKDFWGNDYQSHTKCISEEEKYCGKGFVPKVNKGEVKQEQWTEKVQDAIEKSKSNPKLKGLLERLKDYPNIPRKRAKFENFLKNSLRVNNASLISQVWDTLMAAAGQENGKQNGHVPPTKEVKQLSHHDVKENGDTGQKDTGKKDAEKEEKTNNGNTDDNEGKRRKEKRKLSEKEENLVKEKTAREVQENNDVHEQGEFIVGEQKLSKRERKEERRKKANKKEKKDKTENVCTNEEKNKGKKRKHSESEEKPEEVAAEPSDRKKKKKKVTSECKEEVNDVLVGGNDSERKTDTNNETSDKKNKEVAEPKKKKIKKAKFNWEATILAVLKSKKELSLKRLQKKVFCELEAQDAACNTGENLIAKFHRKVNKMPRVKVVKDRVILK